MELRAIIVHDGKSIGGGHYRSMVKTRGTDEWVMVDDSRMYKVVDVAGMIAKVQNKGPLFTPAGLLYVPI